MGSISSSERARQGERRKD